MFPSSGKVKLNRVPLKDVVGLKLTPRRRRPLKLTANISADSSKKAENNSVSESVSEEVILACSREAQQTCFTQQHGPENGTDTPNDIHDGELEECVGMQRAKRKNGLLSCSDMECKQNRPNTREICRNPKPNSNGPAGSEGYLRRSVGPSRCIACGDCKSISSQPKRSGNQGSKLGSELRTPEFKIKPENTVGQTPEKIIVWINQYPKVTLCDVTKTCDACSHGCAYMVPDVLKIKVVRCFNADMRAGLRYLPVCFGQDKSKSEEAALAALSENVCEPQSLTHQIRSDEGRPGKTAQRLNSRTNEDSATCSPVFSVGKRARKGRYRTAMLSREVDKEPRPGSDPVGVDVHRNKRLKLGENGVTCSPAVKDMDPCDQRGAPTDTNGTKTSPEPVYETDEDNADDPGSFTCQRVKAYTRKTSFSCARTYKPWPFLGSIQTYTARDAAAVSSAGEENLSQAGSSSNQIKSLPPDAPLQNQEQDGGSISGGKAEESPRVTSTHPERTKMEISCHKVQPKESLSSLCLDAASLSVTNGHQRELGIDKAPSSPFPVSELGTNSSMSTPSPSALSLSGCDITSALFPASDPSTKGASSSPSATPPSHPPSSSPPHQDKESETVEKSAFDYEETQMTSCSSLSSGFPHNLDSFHSRESSPFLSEDKHKNEEIPPERSPPKLEPCYSTSPFKHKCSLLCHKNGGNCVEIHSDEFTFPPVLSPVTSPQRHLCRMRLSSQSSSTSEKEEKDVRTAVNRSRTLTECQVSWIVDGGNDNSKKALPDSSPANPPAFPSSDEDAGDRDKDDVDQDKRSSEQVPLDPETKTTVGSGVLAEAHSSPSSDEDADDDDEGEQDSVRGGGSSSPNVADDPQPGVLDEFTAYKQDILLVGVIQEDPELFRNLPEESLLRLGPARAAVGPKKNLSSMVKMSQVELERRLAPGAGDFHLDDTGESDSRPWRPRCNTNPTKLQGTCPGSDKHIRHVVQSDTNNNHVNVGLESIRNQPIHTVNSPHNTPPLTAVGTGPWIKSLVNVTDFRRQKSTAYCRQYFSESQACGFKNCRFQHLPLEGDEKFCMENVMKFTKHQTCLQKAGAVFAGYYQNNPPGVYFSMPVLLNLLWALLKAGMMSDVFSVLSVNLAHSVVPGHDFLLNLFTFVRENSLMCLAPELMQLTVKMASVGLELSLDCLDCIKNAPVFKQAGHANSPVAISSTQKLSSTAPYPEHLNLACAIIEIELCTKLEDWKRMGEVFKCICQSSYHPNQVERISGRIAIALLSESKDKLTLPFAGFAEMVCQNDGEDSLIKNFIGRIGVSLILRYHKTQHWAKGRKVVEILSSLKVGYATLKSFFGNEDGASRCHLVTLAAELLLLSGSVEGALHSLRENKWFLSSCSWPCEPADLESRTRLLMRLAEKTSHRDTLEVLCNLPGITEPNEAIDISRYTPLFNSHLQACVDRQILPVASDTVDFMLSKKLAVEYSVLQTLLHKLGKQNLWLRAREVFRHSLNMGYYSGVSAPRGFMSLIVPCGLSEVELALVYEMFITVNASVILPLPETTTASLSITLKRTQSCESEYLSAGSCLLSAACILQPKLTVHYTTVNSSQEQVFRLDVSSARRWIRHNHLWASEIWPH